MIVIIWYLYCVTEKRNKKFKSGRREKFEFIQHKPKFLRNIKLKYVQRENKIEDKYFSE